MPVDLAAQTASLANDYGAAKGPNAPESFEVDLYAGHPDVGGSLLTTGYTPPPLTNDGTGFPTVTSGRATSELVTFSYTDDLTEPATHWCLRDPATDERWDAGELGREFLGGAGTSDSLQVVVFYSEEG